jgi:hypothetical protein
MTEDCGTSMGDQGLSTTPSPDRAQERGEPKRPFVLPRLVKAGSFPEVTTQLVGEFSA